MKQMTQIIIGLSRCKRQMTQMVSLAFYILLLSSCSLTKNIPDDDQLFRGLKEIVYIDELSNKQPEDKVRESQESTMKEEVEAALATIPNGSLFFSSYYAAPWSWLLWVYNT